MEEIDIIDTVGPLFSNGGFKNWLLSFARDRLVFIPLGIGPSVKGGLAAGAGSIGLMNAVYARDPDGAGERKIDVKPEYTVLPLSEITAITMKKVIFGANELRILEKKGKKHKYGIGERAQTDIIKNILGKHYSTLYHE